MLLLLSIIFVGGVAVEAAAAAIIHFSLPEGCVAWLSAGARQQVDVALDGGRSINSEKIFVLAPLTCCKSTNLIADNDVP